VPKIFIPIDISDEMYAQLLAGHGGRPVELAVIGETSKANLPRQFVESLTELCQQAVMAIALASRTPGNPISRTTVAQQIGLSADQISGVFGTIGRHWASTYRTPNPFAARRRAPNADPIYAIDPDLAEQLISEIQATADRWRMDIQPRA
jgi:hypothetical protein